MGETGFVRFPRCLDPRAEEFRPRNPNGHNQMHLIHPQIYFPYPPPSEVQVIPFYDGVGYHNYSTPQAHVSPSRENPPLPPPLPPPSTAATRTLLLSSIPTDVSESEVRRELEVFGDVRAVEMKRLRDGIVTVHFYDLRCASVASAEIRRQHMQQQSRLRRHFDAVLARNSVYEAHNLVTPPPPPPPAPGLIAGRAVWAQFMIPTGENVPDGHNQGTLVIFNLDPDVSTSSLKQVFVAFGPVKELRETPLKRHQRFVEFYDIRDAARALSEMNGKEIHGKNVVIEFSRPGGHVRRFSKDSRNTAKKFDFCGRNPRCLPPPFPHKTPGNFQNKKPLGFCRGDPNGNVSGIESSMGSLCVGNGIEECHDGILKKSLKKVQSTTVAMNQPLQNSKMNRALKAKQSMNFDPRFLINGDAIMESNCSDSRTTVMIKNIPNKYSQKLLLNMLDNHCIHCNEQIADGGGRDEQPLSAYDFVYLPIDFINKCNVGYGFVNMTSPQATWRLYKAFHHQNWEVFNSKKICEVTYARLQGVEALKEHFKNSKFPCEVEEYLPVVFSPPRDGRHLTDPNPIVGRTTTTSNSALSPSAVSSNNSETNDKCEEKESEESANNVGRNDGGGDNDVEESVSGGGRNRPNGGDNGVDNDP
ncbi:terminal EAR1-like 1 [Actinidia rufa]|uniref:Terminal EAR1-like 1 n=1 Tax=Actinidia rufa TaxID=165716 RepID=A0A7J0HDL4_9ERIC|nr:terminal EAR1-like 1 [Actinidia rufa]